MKPKCKLKRAGKLHSMRRESREWRFGMAGGRRRRGALLHETTTAVLIVMFVVAGACQMLHLVARQRHLCKQRATASLEVANLMEEIASRSWPEITEQAPKLEISQATQSRLPQSKVRLDIGSDESNADARRIAISLDWQLDDLRRSSPVRLVAWRYSPREMKP